VLTQFWEGVGGKFADRWSEISIPALVFWSSVGLALISRQGLKSMQDAGDYLTRQSASVQVSILIGIFLLVLISGVVVDRLTTPALQFVEGYWPRVLQPLRQFSVRRVEKKAAKARDIYQTTAIAIAAGTASAAQRSQYVWADSGLRRLPAADYQPTRIGNVLLASAERPNAKYGLDAGVVWPCLWLVLPETARTELTRARHSLDLSISSCVWGLLFAGLTPWVWWAVVIGPAVAFVSYRFWAQAQAETFADLFEASFDLYRPNLYTQLRWPLPEKPAEERTTGRAVTEYLWRGDDAEEPHFTSAPS
jgi:hypothetical protein